MRDRITMQILKERRCNSMPASKAQQKATNKYISKAYDRINLTVPKGHKEEIKNHADSREESVNSFINRAIDETMVRDNSVLPDNTNAPGSES